MIDNKNILIAVDINLHMAVDSLSFQHDKFLSSVSNQTQKVANEIGI